MKIFITYGIAGVGKSTAIKSITDKYPNIKIFSPADKLKDICKEIFPDYNPYIQKEEEMYSSGLTVRDFLISIALAIKKIDINFFLKGLLEYDEDILLIDGMRYKHEYEFLERNIPKEDRFIIQITNSINKNTTNDYIDDFPTDKIIVNNKDNLFKEEIINLFERFTNQ